jgi:hypothetical protein
LIHPTWLSSLFVCEEQTAQPAKDSDRGWRPEMSIVWQHRMATSGAGRCLLKFYRRKQEFAVSRSKKATPTAEVV